MIKNEIFELIPKIDSLKTLGIGIEYFPKYINLNPKLTHSLDIILMSFILKGDVSHNLESDSYHEYGLNLSIINYGQRHTITTSKDGAEIVNIYLDLKHYILPMLPEKLQEAIPLFLPIHMKMQNKLNRMIRVNFGEDDNIVLLFKSMNKEMQAAKIGYESAVKDYLRLILIKCARRVLEKHVKPSANLNSDTLKRVRI